jgi:hypothetical protein
VLLLQPRTHLVQGVLQHGRKLTLQGLNLTLVSSSLQQQLGGSSED